MFKTLAHNPNADHHIRHELSQVKIPAIPTGPHSNDVPYTIRGQLGLFTFTRQQNFWTSKGPVPIWTAEQLQAHPASPGLTADGDRTWMTPTGKEVLPTARETGLIYTEALLGPMMAVRAELIFSDDPLSLGAQLAIPRYRIHTMQSFRLFVVTLKAHGLITTPAAE
jgi:hypothetical protein